MAKVENVGRLKRKLTAFPKAAKFEIERAMIKSAREMVSMAKGLVPVDQGALRDSIDWTFGGAPKGSIAIGSIPGPNDVAITVYAGDEVAYYARWVEFGTAPHKVGGMFRGAQHPGAGAQPFFYPAFRSVRKRMKSRVGKAVRSAAKKAASGT